MAQRWYEVDSDPNSRAALRWRQKQLTRVIRRAVMNRDEWITRRCRGDKRVLDLGCVGQLPEGVAVAPLHRLIAESAKECIGVDTNEDGIEVLRREGYSAERGDATNPSTVDMFSEPFDSVVAGELAEHILDLSGLFTLAHNALVEGGEFIVSSPNPFQISNVIRGAFHRAKINVDHVTFLFPSGVGELCDRFSLELQEIRGVIAPRQRSWMTRWMVGLGSLLRLLWPTHILDCDTIVYVLVKPGGSMTQAN